MSFPLIGNEKVRQAVLSQIKDDRLPHAIIIEGENGLGKHTLSAFLSRAALCSQDDKPCGSCQSCHLADVGSHPDIITVVPEDKKKNIAVAQIRQLRQSAYVKPHLGSRRVFIIDKAETMNEQSQNALLKILEEPPQGVFFILIAESAAALLETILSRCVVLKLSTPKIRDSVAWILENIKPRREEAVIQKALDDSKGNIGRAIELLRKRSSDSPEAAAKDFADILFTGDEFTMLCLLNRFEKDRPKADVFLSSFKCEISVLLRNNYNKVGKAKILSELYTLCDGFTESLKTNINLSLLFTEMVATVKRLCKNYL